MLRKIEHVLLIVSIILLIILGISYKKNIISTNNYYNEYIQLGKMYDSIKNTNKSIIDSLSQEIDVRESLIDSFSSADQELKERAIEQREQILELPIDSSLNLLRKNLDEFYEMD